jgi:hypothetical protein
MSQQSIAHRGRPSPLDRLTPSFSFVACVSLNFAIQGINYSYGDYQRASAMAGRVSAFLSDNSDENTDKAQHAASGTIASTFVHYESFLDPETRHV